MTFRATLSVKVWPCVQWGKHCHADWVCSFHRDVVVGGFLYKAAALVSGRFLKRSLGVKSSKTRFIWTDVSYIFRCILDICVCAKGALSRSSMDSGLIINSAMIWFWFHSILNHKKQPKHRLAFLFLNSIRQNNNNKEIDHSRPHSLYWASEFPHRKRLKEQ